MYLQLSYERQFAPPANCGLANGRASAERTDVTGGGPLRLQTISGRRRADALTRFSRIFSRMPLFKAKSPEFTGLLKYRYPNSNEATLHASGGVQPANQLVSQLAARPTGRP